MPCIFGCFAWLTLELYRRIPPKAQSWWIAPFSYLSTGWHTMAIYQELISTRKKTEEHKKIDRKFFLKNKERRRKKMEQDEETSKYIPFKGKSATCITFPLWAVYQELSTYETLSFFSFCNIRFAIWLWQRKVRCDTSISPYSERPTRLWLPHILLIIIMVWMHNNFLCNQIRRVETDTKLSNHAYVCTSSKGLHEGLGARSCNSPKIIHQIWHKGTKKKQVLQEVSFFTVLMSNEQ